MFELFELPEDKEALPEFELVAPLDNELAFEPEDVPVDTELPEPEVDELRAPDALEAEEDEESSSSADAPTLETTSTFSSVEMASFGETTARRDVSPCCASTFTTVPMISPRA